MKVSLDFSIFLRTSLWLDPCIYMSGAIIYSWYYNNCNEKPPIQLLFKIIIHFLSVFSKIIMIIEISILRIKWKLFAVSNNRSEISQKILNEFPYQRFTFTLWKCIWISFKCQVKIIISTNSTSIRTSNKWT